MKSRFLKRLVLGLMSSLGLANFVLAEEAKLSKTEELEEVVVREKRVFKKKTEISIKFETFPAQVNVITSEELKNQIITRHEEVFRKIPGVYVENYGQGDIGSAITMRGLGGGGGGKRYVTTYIDDVPQNYPIYFGDQIITWLIPEMVERIEVVKGPFSSFCGDNSIGGCFNLITKDLESNKVLVSAGSHETYRGVPIFGYYKNNFHSFLLAEYYNTHGYRDNSDYDRYNFFGKIVFPLREHKVSLRFNYYNADWEAPGYLSLSELKKGVVKRRETLTPDAGGDSELWSLVLRYTPKKEEGLYFTGYYNNIELNRYVAFPLYKTSSVSYHARVFNTKNFGFRTYYNLLLGNNFSLIPGLEFKYDVGDYMRYPTIRRRKSGNFTQYWDTIYKQYSFWAQVQFKPLEKLKLIGGIRYDRFDYDIKNKVVLVNSGEGDTSILSPKIGLAFLPIQNFEFFANWSKGARAPYMNEVSPHSPSQRKNFNLDPAEVSSWDIGFTTSIFNKLQLTLDYFDTELKREVAIINNEPVNIGHTVRKGIEIETKFLILPKVILWGSYSLVSAKVKNPQVKGQDRVIDVPKNLLKLGLEYTNNFNPKRSLSIDLYYYYISGKYYYPGTSSNPLQGPVYDRYALNLVYRLKKISTFLLVNYVPRKYSSQITWLNGNEIQVNPEPHWNLHLGIKFEF